MSIAARNLGGQNVSIELSNSTVDLQFKMLMAFIEKDLLPKNIAAGQLSGEIFKTSSNSCFVISRFASKSEADKIISIMRAELDEMKGTNKIKLIEGERIIFLTKKCDRSQVPHEYYCFLNTSYQRRNNIFY